MSNDASAGDSVISLPGGGGAVSGLGEKFTPDLFTGTGNYSVPLSLPAGRAGLTPQLTLAYSTGTGNGLFGQGWAVSLPAVTRRTARGVPRYADVAGTGADQPDVFVLSGAEDLVPVAGTYPGRVRYRPRTEGMFARIEHVRDASGDYWEVRTRDGRLTRYGTPRPDDADADWRDPAAVADPDDPGRVYGWRVAETRDAPGNLVRYEYGRDRGDEPGHRWDQPLLTAIRYADYGDRAAPSFLVAVEFEYEPRPDPVADRRAGFEQRTTVRCTTIRTVTTAADEVRRVSREVRLGYAQAPFTGTTMLSRVDVVGIDGDATEPLPPLTFEYSAFDPAGRTFQPVSGPALPTRPLSDPAMTLVDLRGVGLPDLVELGTTRQAWSNSGGGRFARPRSLSQSPPVTLADPGTRLLDADGDGRPDLVTSAGNGTTAGYYPMAFGAGWSKGGFQPYRRTPSVSLADPAVRLVDLDGDGLTDVLRSGTQLEAWFNDRDPALAWNRTVRADAALAAVDLADPRVRMADMTGDGLQDLVLLGNGALSYRPNLGHNRWGELVVMRGAPRFPVDWNARQVLLGDVDGDGLADLVYVDGGRVLVWLNRSGTEWTDEPVVVPGTPGLVDGGTVQLCDLHGTGMAGLLFTGGTDAAGRPRLRFLDLTGGVKPHLLTGIDNHLGARTTIRYTPSTLEYLRDEDDPDNQWRTTLPMPVHVVAGVEVEDGISAGRLTSEYRYHHGYWDGVEREFRGFALVDQYDAETVSADTDPRRSPPTLTRTWFHPGPVAAATAADWTELDLGDGHWPVDPQVLTRPKEQEALLAGLPRDARRSALRALRGHVLRSETYALDGTGRQNRPYTVTETVCGVREEDPDLTGSDREPVFFPYELATRTSQWERGAEPMTSFTFTAAPDPYGYPTGHLAVAVPRGRDPLAAGGGEPYLATYGATEYARRDDADRYHVDRPARTVNAEVINDGAGSVFDLRNAVLAGTATLRPTGETRTYYDGDAFTGLPLGTLGEHGVATRTATLAFGDAFLAELHPDGPPPFLDPDRPADPAWTDEYPAEFRDRLPALAGYSHEDGGWWTVCAHSFDVHDPAQVPRGLPTASLDPFGGRSEIVYDGHELLPARTTDPVGLTVTAEHDLRVLRPHVVTDVNGNQHEVTFSPAGLVTGQWARGRDGAGDRDVPSTAVSYDLLAWDRDRRPAAVRTVRRVHHDTDTDVPAELRDETITSVELSDGFGRVVQKRTQAEDTLYGDQAFGGGLLPTDLTAPVGGVAGRTRGPGEPDNVIVSGWQVYDNKGRVIRSYEPFFGTGYDWAPPPDDRFGRATDSYYDPRGQLLRTVAPDGSERRTVPGIPAAPDTPDDYTPTPWESFVYDANDNAGRTHPDAALAYRSHWNTPTQTVLDPLGRAVRTVGRTGPTPADELVTTSGYDIQGHLVSVTDALGREAFRYSVDLAGRRWRVTTLDAGIRDTVPDATGRIVESRDSRGALVLSATDSVHRLTHVWARDDAEGTVTLRQRLEYGDGSSAEQPAADRDAARKANMLGHAVRHYDEAGLVSTDAVDFKGNVLRSTRHVIADAPILATYDAAAEHGWQVRPFTVDWTPAAGQTAADRAAELLDPAGYLTDTAFDGLNRVVLHTFPSDVDGARRRLAAAYNRAGALDQVRLDDTVHVRRIAYDAKGQRVLVAYGNGALTRCGFDPDTFRLSRQRTEPCTTTDDLGYTPSGPVLQDVGYERDLIGNVLALHDRTPGSGIPADPAALSIVDPVVRALVAAGDALDRVFSYDPVYRLTSATGREHQAAPPGDPWSAGPRGDDPSAVQPYQERYSYDAAGNLLRWEHAAAGGFTREFAPGADGDRLGRMTTGSTPVDYTHDANGNLLTEGGSRGFGWDHADRLRTYATRTPGAEPSVHVHHLYDAAGKRVVKLVRRQGGAVEVTHYPDETFEHTRWSGGANNHVHVLDDTQRVALVRIGPAHPEDGGPEVAVHLGDHLGSSTLVLDGAGAVTNREEYAPYGETTFGGYTRKRYRFTGRERDEESGLTLHGLRYALPWTGRWSACDPVGQAGGLNQYLYAAGNPIGLRDPDGTDARTEKKADNAAVTAGAAAKVVHNNPKGRTLAVPDNFDKAKIKAYKQRIQDPTDRAVGLRSDRPGLRSKTDDIRAANQGLVDDFVDNLPGGVRPAGMQVDHTVELQHIIRRNAPGAETVRPQDHRLQQRSLNASQGKRAQLLDARRISAGAPLDVPAGGVARERDVNKFWNREGYRTGVRVVGVYNLAGGTYAALNSVGDAIRAGDAGSAALGTSAYLGGAFELGGLGANSTMLLNAGRVLGAPAAVAGAGMLGWRIGTHLNEHYVNHELAMDVGSVVEEKTGSRVLGGVAAAGTATASAVYHAPGAAVDYIKDNMTLDPDEIDWGRTVRPWEW